MCVHVHTCLCVSVTMVMITGCLDSSGDRPCVGGGGWAERPITFQ